MGRLRAVPAVPGATSRDRSPPSNSFLGFSAAFVLLMTVCVSGIWGILRWLDETLPQEVFPCGADVNGIVRTVLE